MVGGRKETPMKDGRSVLLVATLVLASAFPAAASVGGVGEKVAASLGLRYDRPVGQMKVGQTHPATILNASKLSPRGVTGRNGDKVVLTLTGRQTFSLHHPDSGRTLHFRWDDQGTVTPIAPIVPVAPTH
jgi:hypothetical protein